MVQTMGTGRLKDYHLCTKEMIRHMVAEEQRRKKRTRKDNATFQVRTSDSDTAVQTRYLPS